MIALRNVIKGHATIEKINLRHSYYFFDDIKNIDLYMLAITKSV